MKRFLLVPALVIGVFTLQGCHDDDNPHPGNQTVESTFTEKYPGASRVDWEKKGEYWVVDFRKDSKEMEAWFDQAGEWRLTETDLLFNALPEVVRTTFSSGEYKTWRVDDVDMIERKDKETFYVLEVESGNQEYDLYYSPNGTLIKAERDYDNDNDNEEYLSPSFSI